MQRFWYKRLLINSGEAGTLIKSAAENDAEAAKDTDFRWRKLQGLMTQLRKVAF
jgi:hypothetical protein